MKKRTLMAKLLGQNPHIDREEVEAGLRTIETLEQMGVPKKGYSLRAPFQRGIIPMKRKAIAASMSAGAGSSASTRKTRGAKRTRIRRVKLSHAGVVVLNSTEFAELEGCLQTPQQPTASIQRGAELLERFPPKSR